MSHSVIRIRSQTVLALAYLACNAAVSNFGADLVLRPDNKRLSSAMALPGLRPYKSNTLEMQ